MIKRFNKFNEDFNNKPGQDVDGSVRVELDSNEVELFNAEPALQKLISDQKVSLFSNCIWFDSNDTKTIDVLKVYIDFDLTNELVESVNESNEDKKTRMTKELSDLDKRIKDLQKEYGMKEKEISKIENKISYKDKMKAKVERSKEVLNRKK